MNTTSEIHLQALVYSLRLTISLGVISFAGQQCCIIQLEQIPPKATDKDPEKPSGPLLGLIVMSH
jgi:hypothetical protein